MLRAASLSLAFSLLATHSWAAPTIQNVTPRGLQIGGVTRITITGSELAAEPQLLLPDDGTAVLVGEAKPNQLQFDVTLPAEAKPGIRTLRVSSATGISAAVKVGVDDLPQAAITASIEQLPIALTGDLTGAQLVKTAFAGKQGDRVVVDVEAQRLGSKLRPVVRLLDERGSQIAFSPQQEAIAGDARLEFILPHDGQYLIQLQDALYKGAGPGYFRMKIGDLHYADLTFPLGVARESTVELEPLSSSLGDTKLTAAAVVDFAPTVSPAITAAHFTGAVPRLLVSQGAEFSEQREKPGERIETPAAPVTINGRFLGENERDEYLVPIEPGKKYRVEVLAQRLGTPVDGVLEVHKSQGGSLGSNDDQPNTSDSGLTFDAPADVSKLLIVLRDLQGRYGPEFVYRIEVTPLSIGDFTLTADSNVWNVPAGGVLTTAVTVKRRGYGGPIELTWDGELENFTLSGATIPAGATATLLSISAKSPGQFEVARLIGKASIGGREVVKNVVVKPSDAGYVTADEVEIGLGVDQHSKLGVALTSAFSSDKLSLGETLTAPVQIVRGAGVTGPVRLKLLTTQVTPQKEVPDPKNAKKKIKVDDVERTLRLAADVIIPADQTDAQVQIATPQDLADHSWDLAIVAELLSADQKQVIATATTSAQRFSLASPIYLQLAGETIFRRSGKLVRAGGFQGAATISVSGLPEGATAEPVEVPADKSDYTIEIKLPAGVSTAALANVKVTATSKTGEADVTSNAVEISLPIAPQ
ncbi:serine proteinase [Blastopirellula marina]|uniref:Probable serine proteinase, subtilase family protein n=1 Tax=Blastopirellula marina DSM 3645 TaxID=314230 RepID=A3ZSS3_9BACT|nr:serine proteinase [Blastopirellula marina]EAQ80347.1 probable serine proteinase, subtilase family protein [Blastopirellula marina DSM 3645]